MHAFVSSQDKPFDYLVKKTGKQVWKYESKGSNERGPLCCGV